MTITKTIDGNNMTVAIEGRLDTITAPEFETEIKGNIDGIENLTLDMGKLEYISSAGLRVILSAQKIMNKQGKMVVKNVPEVVMEVLEITSFVDILNIEE